MLLQQNHRRRSPGIASNNLTTLPFKNKMRKLYPLDGAGGLSTIALSFPAIR
jgi:hypothetical protein